MDAEIFSDKIIAHNLSFCSPLACKYAGDGIFHFALMYQFNIWIRVSNLSLKLTQCNLSHDFWVSSRRCQFLDSLQGGKQQSAFNLIRALILALMFDCLEHVMRYTYSLPDQRIQT